ncbi:hypothetical protein [uncultured Ferrovibrio sp.]|jgi:hypothetical protein|uniref:hypothetical protein n=1 Tax=uncultured Ferrovibrio sp. TaxID=1576913 RepID=UPI00262DDBC3|nr:hypothetical protein [uncultured Ferrovibrio sp.]
MSEAYLIEAAGEAAGVVIRERGGFRFFASAPQYQSIEQQLFRRAADAERAARALGRAFGANDNLRQKAWR